MLLTGEMLVISNVSIMFLSCLSMGGKKIPWGKIIFMKKRALSQVIGFASKFRIIHSEVAIEDHSGSDFPLKNGMCILTSTFSTLTYTEVNK